MRIPKEMASMYRSRTSPENWASAPDITNLKTLLLSLPDKFAEDFKNGLFKKFRSYKTSTDISINTFDDALTFNHFHEGTHVGIILGQIKLV